MIEILNKFKTNFNNNDFKLLSNYFNTKKIGIIDINFIDSINKIYYNSASFKEYNTNSNDLNQIAYVESFKEDKIYNKNTIINSIIILLVF